MGVGGADTARGISFQHAQAVAACLDVLESEDAAKLRVEGSDDVIDFEVCASDGQRLRVCQAKTRKEPYRWEPASLVRILERWQLLPHARDAQFEFLTDGGIGPEVAGSLQPALKRAGEGGLTTEDRAYLQSKGLDPDNAVLKRSSIKSRQPSADVTLDRVTVRLLRLLEMGAQPADTARAEALVNVLFRMVSTRSGLEDPGERVITRTELAELLEVPLDVIDRAQQWTPATEQAYVEALRAVPPQVSFVPLQTKPESLQPDALAFVVRTQAEAAGASTPSPATDVLNEPAGAIISGPAGAGKSTTLELLVPAALDGGLVPVLVSVAGYETNALRRLVRETLERTLRSRLAPGATSTWLRRDGALLLLDGAGELEAEAREALIFDVQALRRAYAKLRVVVTSRDATRLRGLYLPGFVLQGLDSELRRRVAEQLLQPPEMHLVQDVEQRLGSLVESPLLYVMALALATRGVHARSRADLFDGFIEGLTARLPGNALSDLGLALLRDACFELRTEDTYATDNWTWRRLLARAMDALSAARLYAAGATSADAALSDALAGGLLRVLPGSDVIALSHDLFCDFFAAEAVRLGQKELPSSIGEALEEVAVFLAERDGLLRTRALAVAENPVAAARCARALPAQGQADDREVTELYAALRQHLGAKAQQEVAGTHVRVAELADGTYLFVLPDGEFPVGVDLEIGRAVSRSLRAARVPAGSTALAAAVALWLADVRWLLAATEAGPLLAIPTQRDALPEAVSQAFTERMMFLESLCAAACPTLRSRVLRELNFRGFHAVVLPAQTQSLPFGGDDEVTYHPLAFSFNANDIDVRVRDTIEDGFLQEPSTQMAAEDWLRDSPLHAAQKDLRRGLADLLPGFLR